MVTSEYTITFREQIGEFQLLLLGKIGDDFVINPNLQSITIETDIPELDFLKAISELVNVELIGLIEYKRTLEPDWIGYNA